ncbi:unnamed protein product [Linum trigynum]|uniref:EGF-like domain-containing protein n=1 Tax=Linum trigynum TaxID=586398 RepID=A0AAV2DPK7_9ROSI
MRLTIVSLLLFSCLHLPLGSSSSLDSHSSEVKETAPSHAIGLLNLSTGSVELHPYDWSYMRVELPSSYSLASISVQSSIYDEANGTSSRKRERLPLMCLRNGGPPIPDVSRFAVNGLVLTRPSEGRTYVQDHDDQCYPLRQNMSFILTYDKVPPGTYYLGFFNGLGLSRNQAKSTKKGLGFSFSANVTAHGCKQASGYRGESCNLRVDHLSAAAAGASCHNSTELKFYSLNVVQVAQQLKLGLKSPNNSTGRNHQIICYARLNALPGNDNGSHDYSVEISKEPLVILLPKIGTWYFKLQPLRPYQEEESQSVCYSMDWQVEVCSNGMAGPNCSSRTQVLKGVHFGLRTMPYVYLPDVTKSKTIKLHPANSTSTATKSSDSAWTYYFFNTSKGTSGKNMYIRVEPRSRIEFDLYVRYSGLPSVDLWDYCYRNHKAEGKNNSIMFKVYEAANEGRISFYLLYPKEGDWIVGLRHKHVGSNNYSDYDQTSEVFVSIESCPNQCSGYGTCLDKMDASGQDFTYSYCSCDVDRGGLDCSEDILQRRVWLLHDLCLIFSNLAALLPGFWTLRQHAYSEAAIFLASGASSGIYHSCDVGLWCFLKFNVLQFLDFWLSFMAIISTFLYIPTIADPVRGSIRVIAAIITATLTVIGPTRSVNVAATFALGALCLLLGWLIQYFTDHHRGRRQLQEWPIQYENGDCSKLLDLA